jgi:hypothetical protein
MARLPPGSYVYYLDATATVHYETIRFLSPGLEGEDRSAEFGRPGLDVDPAKGHPVFVLMNAYMGTLADLRAMYPEGEIVEGPGEPHSFIAYVPSS